MWDRVEYQIVINLLDKTTRILKNSSKDNSETVTNEKDRGKYTKKKSQKFFDNVIFNIIV